MQKIAVFGGTGMTGEQCVRHAINKGLKLRLLYRNENTIPQDFKDSPNLELIQGNVTNYADVLNTIDDECGGVCVALGTRVDLRPTTELSTGLKHIIEAMRTRQIRKVSVCLSAFLYYEREKVPKQFTDLNNEHQRMFDLIKESELDFIAVLPPHIAADKESSEFKILYDSSPGRVITKYDLGKFLIDSLSQPEHYGKVCGIANVVKLT